MTSSIPVGVLYKCPQCSREQHRNLKLMANKLQYCPKHVAKMEFVPMKRME